MWSSTSFARTRRVSEQRYVHSEDPAYHPEQMLTWAHLTTAIFSMQNVRLQTQEDRKNKLMPSSLPLLLIQVGPPLQRIPRALARWRKFFPLLSICPKTFISEENLKTVLTSRVQLAKGKGDRYGLKYRSTPILSAPYWRVAIQNRYLQNIVCPMLNDILKISIILVKISIISIKISYATIKISLASVQISAIYIFERLSLFRSFFFLVFYNIMKFLDIFAEFFFFILWRTTNRSAAIFSNQSRRRPWFSTMDTTDMSACVLSVPL